MAVICSPIAISHFSGDMLGQKSCRAKVPRIFRIFVPNFAPNSAPNFPRIFSRSFRASFRGKRRPEKIHQKSPPFFNAKFPGKHEKTIHKMFLESRQSNDLVATSHYRVGYPLPNLPCEINKCLRFSPPQVASQATWCRMENGPKAQISAETKKKGRRPEMG